MKSNQAPRKKVSAVVACYNELGNIPAMYERLTATLSALPYEYELIFVENGSKDDSLALLHELSERDTHVHVLVLSRNFGSQAAFSSGLDYASGDCAVLLDGDLQDPPEVIPAFVARWEEGFDVAYGERIKRAAPPLLRMGYRAFYRLFSRLSYLSIPVDAGDFGLMDRRVTDVLNAMPERDRFLRGLRAWAGFRQCGVPYQRAARHSGKSTNSIAALFRWAFSGLVSFSYAPLEFISLLAIGVIALTGVALLVYLVLFFVTPAAPRGFETILIAVLFLGAIQLLCLSIVGTYVAKIFEEVKQRPKYLVDRVVHRSPVGSTGANGAAIVPTDRAPRPVRPNGQFHRPRAALRSARPSGQER
jgi:glycosyltransferase involved in cell wall biosynthesis